MNNFTFPRDKNRSELLKSVRAIIVAKAVFALTIVLHKNQRGFILRGLSMSLDATKNSSCRNEARL